MYNTSYTHGSRIQTDQTQENKWDNKQPIGKQHADNQSEEKSYRGGKSEKKEETGKKNRIKQTFFKK